MKHETEREQIFPKETTANVDQNCYMSKNLIAVKIQLRNHMMW